MRRRHGEKMEEGMLVREWSVKTEMMRSRERGERESFVGQMMKMTASGGREAESERKKITHS